MATTDPSDTPIVSPSNDVVINTKIQQRYDSLDKWIISNPILLQGEVARVRLSDGTVRTKTGTGSSTFKQLSWDDKNLYISDSSNPIPMNDGNIQWGGTNHQASFGPIDAAMVPRLGANRFAFMPADAVEVEYSNDYGATWIDYGATNQQKSDLFSGAQVANLVIGKHTVDNPANIKDYLRITITQSKANLYTILQKFVLYISTNGSSGTRVTIKGLLNKDITNDNAYVTLVEKQDISGWSGYNIINESSNPIFGAGADQYGKLQFIFNAQDIRPSEVYGSGLTVYNIFGFGGVGWTTPSNMARNGHIYSYDYNQSVTFPGAVGTSVVPSADSHLTNKKYVDTKFNSLTTDNLKNGSDTLILNGNWSF